mmetsp:Transcript_2175/g.8528  ORF Transcript_2175/g.8528 Transcript_2175/m.8528 type:complete len:85 (-) Transcript_2175:404-658(-)
MSKCLALTHDESVSQIFFPSFNVVRAIQGGADQVVPFARGKLSADLLSDMGRNVEFKRFPNMPHSADMEEMKLVQDFLRNVLTK